MSVNMTWGGNPMPLPDIDKIQVEDVPIGVTRRMALGTLRSDVVAVKARITVTWSYCTAAERATLKGEYDALSEATLALPDGQSYTVVAVGNSWREQQFYERGDVPRYTITVTFEEV